jgi:chromosome segregation ATPase
VLEKQHEEYSTQVNQENKKQNDQIADLQDQNRKLILEKDALRAAKEAKEKEMGQVKEEVKEKQEKIEDLNHRLDEYEVVPYKIVQDVYNKVYEKDEVVDKHFKFQVNLDDTEKDREFIKELSKVL